MSDENLVTSTEVLPVKTLWNDCRFLLLSARISTFGAGFFTALGIVSVVKGSAEGMVIDFGLAATNIVIGRFLQTMPLKRILSQYPAHTSTNG